MKSTKSLTVAVLFLALTAIMLTACGSPTVPQDETVEMESTNPALNTANVSIERYTDGELYLVYRFTDDASPVQKIVPSEGMEQQFEESRDAWEKWAHGYTTDLIVEYNGAALETECTFDNTYKIKIFDECEKTANGSYRYYNLNESAVSATISAESDAEVSLYFNDYYDYSPEEHRTYHYPRSESVS